MTQHEDDNELSEAVDKPKMTDPERTEPEAIPLGPETQAIIIQSIN
jgi:hypothetical protein